MFYLQRSIRIAVDELYILLLRFPSSSSAVVLVVFFKAPIVFKAVFCENKLSLVTENPDFSFILLRSCVILRLSAGREEVEKQTMTRVG